jgi:hypothetical protein
MGPGEGLMGAGVVGADGRGEGRGGGGGGDERRGGGSNWEKQRRKKQM